MQLIKYSFPGSQLTLANDTTSLIKFHTKGEICTSKITHTPQDKERTFLTQNSNIPRAGASQFAHLTYFISKFITSSSKSIFTISTTTLSDPILCSDFHQFRLCISGFAVKINPTSFRGVPCSFTQPQNELEFSSSFFIDSKVFAAWRRILVLFLWLLPRETHPKKRIGWSEQLITDGEKKKEIANFALEKGLG